MQAELLPSLEVNKASAYACVCVQEANKDVSLLSAI